MYVPWAYRGFGVMRFEVFRSAAGFGLPPALLPLPPPVPMAKTEHFSFF